MDQTLYNGRSRNSETNGTPEEDMMGYEKSSSIPAGCTGSEQL